MREIAIGSRRITVESGTALFDGFWSRVASGAWEPETFALMDRILREGSRFVDIGAWIGPTTLYAAARGATVDAYECDPIALQSLTTNIALNPPLSERIAVHPVALGDASRTARVFSGQLGNSETSIYREHEREGTVNDCADTVLVPMRDAAEVFRERQYAASESTLIKIDVEGAEFLIVPRLADIIGSSRAVWYVSFHEWNVNSAHVPARFPRLAAMLNALLGFSALRWFDPDLRELDKVAVLDQLVAGNWPAHHSLVFSAQPLAG